MPTPLTQKAVNAAISAGVDTELVDARARGLALRIRAGKWSWHLRRSVSGRAHRFILGGGWTLDEARGLAFQFETMVAEGSPPWREGRRAWDVYLTRRQAERAGVTVERRRPRATPSGSRRSLSPRASTTSSLRSRGRGAKRPPRAISGVCRSPS